MTEEQIIAYVDGELGPIEALRFERAIEADPAMAVEVERHRRLRAMVAGHFAPVPTEPLPERLTALLDSNVVAFRPARKSWFGQGGRYAALAASLVAGLIAGQFLPLAPSAPIGEQGGAVVAQGDLADALDNQLASAEQSGPYRIGVSFRRGDARYCRTFAGKAGVGIGCRDDRGWTLERFVADKPPEAAAYRQAGSASADILAAAQDMMAGNPLDAAAEKAVQARGWR